MEILDRIDCELYSASDGGARESAIAGKFRVKRRFLCAHYITELRQLGRDAWVWAPTGPAVERLHLVVPSVDAARVRDVCANNGGFVSMAMMNKRRGHSRVVLVNYTDSLAARRALVWLSGAEPSWTIASYSRRLSK